MKHIYTTLLILITSVCYGQAKLGSHTVTLINPWAEDASKYSIEMLPELYERRRSFPDSLKQAQGYSQLAISLKEGLFNGKFLVLDGFYNEMSLKKINYLVSRVDTVFVEDPVTEELEAVTMLVEFIFPDQCSKVDIVFDMEFDVSSQTMNYTTREYIIYREKFNEFGEQVGTPILFILKPKT